MIREAQVEALEGLSSTGTPAAALREFVLPAGRGRANCHLARSICRRAERRCWALARAESLAALAPLP